MSRLLIATHNPGKLWEVQTVFTIQAPNVKTVSLSEVGIMEECEETGSTYAENSLLKARFFWERAKMPVLADDGGLEIDALDGAPGLHSRRFGGRIRNDEELRRLFLEAVSHLPPERRTARMRIILTFMIDEQHHYQAEGSLAGEIRDSQLPLQPGYPARSIFWIPERGKFLQQFTSDDLANFSHRAQAIRALLPHLKQHFV